MARVYLFDEDKKSLIREWRNNPARDQTCDLDPVYMEADTEEKALASAKSFVSSRGWYRDRDISFLVVSSVD